MVRMIPSASVAACLCCVQTLLLAYSFSTDSPQSQTLRKAREDLTSVLNVQRNQFEMEGLWIPLIAVIS